MNDNSVINICKSLTKTNKFFNYFEIKINDTKYLEEKSIMDNILNNVLIYKENDILINEDFKTFFIF